MVKQNRIRFSRRLSGILTTLLAFGATLLCGLSNATELSIQNLGSQATGQQIQDALDGLTDGGQVVLDGGTYLIRKPIILQRDYQVLRGAGPSTILRLDDNANCPVVILGAPANPLHRPIGHLRLADLSIDGNRVHQQVELWRTAWDGSQINNNGVDVRGVTDSIVERVSCCRCRSGGLVSSGTVRRLTVRDFTAFDNHYDGLACYLTEDSQFTKLFLHDNRAAGISLDLAFNHNVIDQAVLSGNDLGIFMRDARNNVFEDLTIRQNRRHGVFMAQSGEQTNTGWRLAPGTECVGNRFEALQITECGPTPFLVNDLSCTNNLFSSTAFTLRPSLLTPVAATPAAATQAAATLKLAEARTVAAGN